MIRALIIEDEPHAQRELKRLLDDLHVDVKVDGYADSVDEAIELIDNHRVDLIFMDIQLSDGLSFDIFQEIEVDTPVIFTTAFDEYAIRAFKVNSVDYLLKPVEPEALEAALKKFEKNQVPSLQMEALMKAFQPPPAAEKKFKSRWAVKVGDKIKTFTSEDIAYFYADDDSLYLVPKNGSAVIIDGSLSQLVEETNPNDFFQISRKLVVSYPSIQKVERYGTSQYALELLPSFTERVLVSRARTKAFMKWLNQ
ncbi:LytR/AlgR family response regulator transcription factor [Phaeocystidibacter luteus]|uniref:Response regulator transcription factor n=1 Tax=Phaeocystidibacter luteus TaxID=911197 RepID=A0A6N6RFF3_9FLAO|nr:LytTR family DNA-binding domain-containing protein [Phaeocystidibacter luteus]KAB2808055.1 response regulator transcription factor [Phaeocystidibacter luteus]